MASVSMADQCVSRIELSVSCQNLVNMDTFSKSDPLIALFLQENNTWTEIGRTEMIKDNLNPKFVKSIVVDYHFEEIQSLKFVCVDVDNLSAPLDKQDLIGEVHCKLADIITSRESTLVRELKLSQNPSAKRGTLTVVAEEVHELNYQARFQFAGRHLDKKDFFGKSDPYLVISRVREGNMAVPVCKTEVIKNTLDPQWKPFTTTVQKLCNGDYDRPLLFECFDWNRSGKADLIGQFKTNLRDLVGGERKEFELIEPHKAKKKGYKNSGTIMLVHCEIIKTHSFLDYIAGGCEISLIVAIDFTASNGNPQYANSLHYNNPYEPNEYVKAITTVGAILGDYDYDRKFPVYGFGAKLPPSGQVSHCFPLNGDFSNPEVNDVAGILDVYQRAISTVTLYGPTNFAPVLRIASQIAATGNSQEVQKYFILLIITDGVISDMESTIDEIVKANNLPLSIVIVGVGSADFTNMDILDADDNPLKSSSGEYAKRDIVQFVPMCNFKNAPPARLAKETLAEIPGQLLTYMQSKGFKPNPPANRPDRPEYIPELMPPYQQGAPPFQGAPPPFQQGPPPPFQQGPPPPFQGAPPPFQPSQNPQYP